MSCFKWQCVITSISAGCCAAEALGQTNSFRQGRLKDCYLTDRTLDRTGKRLQLSLLCLRLCHKVQIIFMIRERRERELSASPLSINFSRCDRCIFSLSHSTTEHSSITRFRFLFSAVLTSALNPNICLMRRFILRRGNVGQVYIIMGFGKVLLPLFRKMFELVSACDNESNIEHET